MAADCRMFDRCHFNRSMDLEIIIIILYYAIYGSTHKYKKAKIHLKYNLKYN